MEAEREIFLFGSRGAERSAEERELFALLESVGVHVVNPDDIEESIRKKFIMISATATGTSYYNMTVGEALASHPVEMRGLIEELCTLFSALGHDLGEGAVERTVERQTFMIPSSTSSMHVDFMAGSSTEWRTSRAMSSVRHAVSGWNYHSMSVCTRHSPRSPIPRSTIKPLHPL